MAIALSELLVNPDGSVFHLHLLPEDLAEIVILAGDPARVGIIASHFECIELEKSNREFHTVTGRYRGHRMTVLSTGIGPDNIDIVINELDALANIDLKTRSVKPVKRSLDIVRIGTSGSLQTDVPVGSFVVSEKSIGCDGVLRFYAGNDAVCDRSFEESFIAHCRWTPQTARPYVVDADSGLVNCLYDPEYTVKGVTMTAVGFYGPQGRVLRLPLAMQDINDRIAGFRHGGYRITNYEMESAPIVGLCNLLGHRSTAVCLIIANRITGDGLTDYGGDMDRLIRYTLDRLVAYR